MIMKISFKTKNLARLLIVEFPKWENKSRFYNFMNHFLASAYRTELDDDWKPTAGHRCWWIELNWKRETVAPASPVCLPLPRPKTHM